MKMRKIKMDDYELKIIINSLNVTRTKLINENKNAEVIDELVLKYIKILDKKKILDYCLLIKTKGELRKWMKELMN